LTRINEDIRLVGCYAKVSSQTEESMKFIKYLIFALILAAMALPALAGQPKARLPLSAYMKSAKIALLSVPPRHSEAMTFLDSVLYYYGPVPEAYFLRGNVYAEYAAKEYDYGKKVELFTKMSANYDSMTAACENKDLKRNLKSDCEKDAALMDSIKVLYWRENYNNGVKAIDRIDNELLPKIKNTTDSTEKAATQEELKAVIDSGKVFFAIAAAVDPGKYRSFEGKGLIFDRMKQYDSSLYYFRKASELVPDSIYLIQNIAYGYIQLNDWDNAITYFNKYLRKAPNDANILFNIAISYSNKKNLDSAHIYDLKAIAADSSFSAAYVDVGQYFLIRSQDLSDSIKNYKQAEKNADADRVLKIRDAFLDSSATYFASGLKYEPDNITVLEQYGVVLLVLGRYDGAVNIFTKLTELEPFRKDHWINLGDIYVQQQKFADAIAPFEKAIEIDPGDAKLWEVLKDLYTSNNMPDKAKKAEEKIAELNKL
jgi:tetratricopeptide (TPR) repeat protein